jgi:hypothetical protein
MEYCRDHPEEISKMVSVQRKVSGGAAAEGEQTRCRQTAILRQ